MISRAAIALAVGLSGVVVVGGCGGGDGKASDAPAVSKAQFTQRANAICREERAYLRERLAGFERRTGGKKPRPYADAVHFVFLPMIEAEISGIEELEVPRRSADQVDAMLDADRTAIDAVAVMPRVPLMRAAERHFIRVGKLFRAYGLDSCANDRQLSPM